MGGSVIPVAEASAFARPELEAVDNPPATREAEECKKLRREVGDSLERESEDVSSDGW